MRAHRRVHGGAGGGRGHGAAAGHGKNLRVVYPFYELSKVASKVLLLTRAQRPGPSVAALLLGQLAALVEPVALLAVVAPDDCGPAKIRDRGYLRKPNKNSQRVPR